MAMASDALSPATVHRYVEHGICEYVDANDAAAHYPFGVCDHPIVCWAGSGHVVDANPSEVAGVRFESFRELMVTPRLVSIPVRPARHPISAAGVVDPRTDRGGAVPVCRSRVARSPYPREWL
jgi:hypothetical protein